jgi:putative tryptophan/tyrosine transport system substrate-binding protein
MALGGGRSLRRRDFFCVVGGAAITTSVSWRTGPACAQGAHPVVGFLSSGIPEQSAEGLAAFRAGLSEAGFAEGRNVAIEYRWGDGYERLSEMASDLVRRKVAVIVAAGGVPSAKAARAATDATPVVFNVGGDPVAFGIVKSLNRPGGNITGVTNFNFELKQKRLKLLHAMVPEATRVALLVKPATPLAQPMAKDVGAAAHDMGLQLHIVRAASEQEMDDAFASMAQDRIQALVVGADAYFAAKSEPLATLVTRGALAAIGSFPRFARAGGLMSYGANAYEQWRLLGLYSGRILSGAKPAELPVLQSTKVELVINLKTAKALRIAVPVSLLGRADEVIE